MEKDSSQYNLCVKGIKIQLVFTLEFLGIDLLKGDPVGRPVEDVHLKKFVEKHLHS